MVLNVVGDGWRTVPIGEIADVIGGGTPSTKDPTNFGGDIPWLTPKDLSGIHDRYMSRGERNLTEKGLNSSSAKLVPPGAVLLTTRAPIGYVAIAESEVSTNQGFRSLVVHKGVSEEYVYYWLVSNTEELKRNSSGSTFGELSGSALKRIQIPLPPLSEQRRIAYVLGTLDDKIELNRRMNETLEGMAQAVFKDWFVDFGPVRAKMEGRERYLPEEIWRLFPDRLVDSELGLVPEAWGVKSLDEIANYRNGLALQKFRPKPDEERLPVVKIAQLRSGIADGGEWATVSITPECVIDDGDVVFSWSGSLLVRVWAGGRAALNQHLFKVTSDKYPKWFYLHFTKHHLSEFQSIAADKTTTMGHIKRQHLREAKCAVPPQSVIDAVDHRLAQLFDQYISNDLDSRHLIEVRDALLPKFVSREVRV